MRQLLTVRRPDGETVLFRFYDPRVLRAHLPEQEEKKAGEFFGPVASYLVEGEEAGQYLVFRVCGQAK